MPSPAVLIAALAIVAPSLRALAALAPGEIQSVARVSAVGHAHLDLTTGRAHVVDFIPVGTLSGQSIWINDQLDANTPIMGDTFALNQTIFPGSEWLDWGDLPWNSRVTGWRFGYITNIHDPGLEQGLNAPTGVPGLRHIMTWYDAENGEDPLNPGQPDPDIRDARGLTANDLFGAPPGQLAAWIYTVSIPQELQFELGDCNNTALTNDSGPNQGIDEDGDSRPDFGFSYSWDTDEVPAQYFPAESLFLGPILVVPGNELGLAPPASIGVEDRIALYLNRRKINFLSFLDQGGYDPTPGNFSPYTSLYLELIGEFNDSCPPLTGCPGDRTTTGTMPGDAGYGQPDGKINLSDLQYYLTIWQNTQPDADVTTTGTAPGDPDYALPDQEVNIADLQFTLTAWQTQCGNADASAD